MLHTSAIARTDRNNRQPAVWLVALSLLGTSFSVPAQVQRSGGGASNQLMQQYQQAVGERTALQAENAKLKQDLDAATKDRDALKKERDALRAKAGGADQSEAKAAQATQAAQQSLEQQRKKMEELIAKYRETALALQSLEKQHAELQTKYENRTTQIKECVDHNQKLKDITNDVLDRYANQSIFKKATLSEPFTRITRSRLENIVDDYRLEVDALSMKDVRSAGGCHTVAKAFSGGSSGECSADPSRCCGSSLR